MCKFLDIPFKSKKILSLPLSWSQSCYCVSSRKIGLLNVSQICIFNTTVCLGSFPNYISFIAKLSSLQIFSLTRE